MKFQNVLNVPNTLNRECRVALDSSSDFLGVLSSSIEFLGAPQSSKELLGVYQTSNCCKLDQLFKLSSDLARTLIKRLIHFKYRITWIDVPFQLKFQQKRLKKKYNFFL